MARGDYVEVTYRTPVGTAVHRMQAKTVGGGVHVTEPTSKSPRFDIEVQDKNGEAIQTARFAATEVLVIIEGHEAVASSARPKKA